MQLKLCEVSFVILSYCRSINCGHVFSDELTQFRLILQNPYFEGEKKIVYEG